MYVSDENIQFIIDMIGSAYGLWKETFDSSVSKNNSYGFLKRRISDFLDNKYAIYSVSSSTGCVVTKKDNVTVTIADGYVIDSDNIMVQVDEQDLSITHYYDYPYDANSHYGVLIGLYYEDIDSVSNIKSSELTTSVTANVSTSIVIRSANAFDGITFPAIVSIDGENILVSSFNSSTKTATIDSSYNSGTGTVGNSHSSGATVYVRKKLSAECIFGVPVPTEYQSGDTSANFQYYPPCPENFLLLAKVLVDKPLIRGNLTNPTAILGSIYDCREIGDQSIDQPFTTEENIIFTDINNTLDTLQGSLSFNDSFIKICNTLKDITIINEDGSRNGSIQDYYNSAPVKRASYFRYGVQWDSLERFEFPLGFRQLWYDVFGEDLLVTFAIFSGDMMDETNTSGVQAPSNLSGTVSEELGPSTGAITPGTWTYYVTAVTASGESPLSSPVVITVPSYQAYNSIDLTWTSVTGATYYHVYRQSSDSSLANDRRITSTSEVVTNSYTDTGAIGVETTGRGCIVTGKQSLSSTGTAVYAKVPEIDDTGSSFTFMRLDGSVTGIDPSSSTYSRVTSNGIRLTINLLKVDGSTTIETIDISSGTQAGYSVQITSDVDYVGVNSIYVSLIDGDSSIIGSRVDWSLQDMVIIQNLP